MHLKKKQKGNEQYYYGNRSLLKMTTSHLCSFYSILYLEQNGLKLNLKLQHCGQYKSQLCCVASVKHYLHVWTVWQLGPCQREFK